MFVKLLATIVLSLAIAGGALFFTTGVSTQSREVGPTLAPGEQALNINASAFIPVNSNQGIGPLIASTNIGNTYLAALQLPQGSTIKRIGFWGKDNDNEGLMKLKLTAQVNDSSTNNVIQNVKTNGPTASNTYKYFVSAPFSHTMKWNRSYFLTIDIIGTSENPPNYMEFRYARVIYTPAP